MITLPTHSNEENFLHHLLPDYKLQNPVNDDLVLWVPNSAEL